MPKKAAPLYCELTALGYAVAQRLFPVHCHSGKVLQREEEELGTLIEEVKGNPEAGSLCGLLWNAVKTGESPLTVEEITTRYEKEGRKIPEAVNFLIARRLCKENGGAGAYELTLTGAKVANHL